LQSLILAFLKPVIGFIQDLMLPKVTHSHCDVYITFF